MTRVDPSERGARDGIGVLLASVLINVVFLTALPSSWRRNQSVDYPVHYAPVARNLLDGKGFRNAEGKPAITYPPGYAFLLTGVFAASRATGVSEMGALRAFNVLSMAVTSLLLYAI